MEEIEVLKRAIKRERLARKQAESIMESKSLELYESNQKLIALNQNLETEIVKRTQEVAQKEIEFKSLVESATEFIFKLDTEGNFTYVNPVTTTISGFTEEDLIGKNFTKFMHPDYIEKLTLLYSKQLENLTENSVIEFPIITKDGEELWINQSVTLVIHNGKPIEFVVLSHDVTEVKMAQVAVAQSEEKYRGIIENLELGILEVDNDNKILKAYPQFCKLTGYAESELIGHSPSALLLRGNGQEILDKQLKERDNGNSSVYELPISKKDGSEAWVIISGSPFYNLKGEQMGTVGIHLDISHRKSIESQLRESKQKTEDLYKVKELFMANMSHEIRTPMNAIIGMAELLEQSKLDAKQDKYVSAIRSSSKNLLVLINDLLDFSKIESGKLTLESIPFHLRELIVKTKELLGPKADENGVQIIYSVDPSLSHNVVGDPIRLGQVLINLVGNAVKFTTNGNVFISAKNERAPNGTETILFEVRDEGIGISEVEMENLFENFTQASQSTARLYGGTGLGLSISQKLVNLMGGNLQVKSKKGVGSTFYFSLELGRMNNEIETDNEVYEIQQNFEQTSILLVEDNPVNILIAKTILENWNCQVGVAENGLQAIEKLKESTYKLVLMDMRMPVMGGMEATRLIRKELNLTLPIIALTGNAIKGDQEKCLEAGMNDYVSKPFEQIDLNKVLTQWIDMTKKEQENLVDLSSLKAMGDPEFIDRMVKLFKEETRKELVILEEAITKADVSKIKGTAHKIKPSAKFVCIDRVYEDIRTIENWMEGEQQLLQKTGHLILDLKVVMEQLPS